MMRLNGIRPRCTRKQVKVASRDAERRLVLGLAVLGFAILATILPGANRCLAQETRYEADWKSIDQRPIPSWFNEAKFGIFVVWGPYAVPAYKDHGYSEWYRHHLENKNSDTWKFHERVYGADFKYEDFAPMMKGEFFDPDFWSDLFVRSGAKYVVVTANYHDGFCLYPSNYDATNVTDRWNSVETGPKRDVLGELFAAGRARGLHMGIYYSLYEWFHPLWLTDRDRYVTEKFHPQFKEVVEGYGPEIIFLDGDWDMHHSRWRSEELAAWLYNESRVKDRVVVNDRWGKVRSRHGDYYASEYGGGNYPPDHPWEENRGIGHSYGYNRAETLKDYDTEAELLRMLSKVAGNGGNLLLDVGPTAGGRIPVIMEERLVQMGEWLKVNGEAIYGTQASPFWPRRFPFGTTTAKGNRIYLHVYGDYRKPLELAGLASPVKRAFLLADPDATLEVVKAPRGPKILPPERWPHPDTVSVAVIEVDGPIETDTAILPDPDGSLGLYAAEARIHGGSPVYELTSEKNHIGYWQNPADRVSWDFRLTRGGTFEVRAEYAVAEGQGGSRFDVAVGNRVIEAATEVTGSWSRYGIFTLGRLGFEEGGDYRLEVRPRPEPRWKSMGLKAIRLVPVEE